jgi:hypothetical protein
MKRINKYIGDPRFLEILNKFLKAGYIDPKTGNLVKPEIGTTQSRILTPLLCNIVLHELDKYMADNEIKFSKGKTRKINPVYKSLINKRFSSIDKVERLNILNEMQKTRRYLMGDPNFRRLDYIRYANDFIVLVSGSLKDAKYILNNIKEFIKANCGLEINLNKTVIVNILNNEWSFLDAKMKNFELIPKWRVKKVRGTPVLKNSYLAQASHGNGREVNRVKRLKRLKRVNGASGATGANGVSDTKVGIAKLFVNAPIDNLLGILKKSGFVRQNKLGNFIPKAYTSIINLTHFEIVSFYNSKLKGILKFDNFDSNRQALAYIC